MFAVMFAEWILAAEEYDQSVTLALYSEANLGIALRRGVDTTQTGFVLSSIICTYGPQRDTSEPSCDVRAGTTMSVTSLDPTTRYFLVALNRGKSDTSLTLIKNLYTTGKPPPCLLPGPLLLSRHDRRVWTEDVCHSVTK